MIDKLIEELQELKRDVKISEGYWDIVDPDHTRVRTEQLLEERLGELMRIEQGKLEHINICNWDHGGIKFLGGILATFFIILAVQLYFINSDLIYWQIRASHAENFAEKLLEERDGIDYTPTDDGNFVITKER